MGACRDPTRLSLHAGTVPAPCCSLVLRLEGWLKVTMVASGCPTAAVVPVGAPGTGSLCPSLPLSARASSCRQVCSRI